MVCNNISFSSSKFILGGVLRVNVYIKFIYLKRCSNTYWEIENLYYKFIVFFIIASKLLHHYR